MKLTLSAKKNDRSWIIYVAAAAGLVSVVMALITILGGPSHIEDVNGEDTSLAVITMEDILSDRHQSVSFMSSTRTSGNGSGVRGQHDDCDVQNLVFSCKKFSGVRTIHTTRLKSGNLLLCITAEVTSGNLALVITVDGEYYCHVPVGGPRELIIQGADGMLVELLAARESAEVNLEVNRIFLVD
jgi:hypothetical protein